MDSEVKLALTKEGVQVVDSQTFKVLAVFTIEDIAEILEFRYAIPWNKSKSILEEIMYILEDIEELYEKLKAEGKMLSKEIIEDHVKKRKTF
ncbi:hypothetical protein PAP_04765 [Palaeococcus pacificus DY20341]|uniref:Uncharacterized protein n=1 Tax=Palaeococcus pacificus DY20341 TaxID=1343739 RepID=A0A075LSS3_9EURY|nr:hypothetical protein [Palaeococcus pacificus]AIF69364.1 hypothetical protein PAP_04765 [Palaeococcus pacificus DY20341]